MNNEMYLIHSEDYISHINDKVRLYSMMKQLTHMIGKLPTNDCTKELIKLSAHFDGLSEEMFRSWGIPKSYLIFGKMDDLAELMENELIAPEDAGYECCDCSCDCEGCSGCDKEYSAEDEYEENVEDFAEMMSELTSVIHTLFGDGVAIHIKIE